MLSLQAVAELPSYIVECVLTIVFSLISHPQLSIRETVTKIMSAYMEHVESQVSEMRGKTKEGKHFFSNTNYSQELWKWRKENETKHSFKQRCQQ